ncbi:30S ribosomal protein S6 [Sulfurospirillum sp. T05]|uniref:Small ribosomal subunit protein bS6 n=1 Tax=Sulfurospirillum tamanense TaxID=2813362 RepID=A0ABS2WQZ4_9BACT|nr:30S ribosomal protein S6 [Sulfurospirillum tamanensis]MBN2963803.1 30S ribosomal protein S6 [Sulfurospirillum tamanensis]
MRHYELLFVLKPTLTEEEVQQKLNLMKEVLEKNGAEIASVLEMGTRRLAYEVQKFERGVYFVVYFTAPTAAIKEVERIIRINEEIIKFMTVKFEKKKELAHWEKLANAAKGKKEEATPAQAPEAVAAPVQTEEVAPEVQEA